MLWKVLLIGCDDIAVDTIAGVEDKHQPALGAHRVPHPRQRVHAALGRNVLQEFVRKHHVKARRCRELRQIQMVRIDGEVPPAGEAPAQFKRRFASVHDSDRGSRIRRARDQREETAIRTPRNQNLAARG